MAERLSGCTDNRRHVLFESRVIDRVNAYRHPGPATAGICRCLRQVVSSQVRHHLGMVIFPTNWRTILAVKRHIEGAGTKFFGHRRLQRQTFAHPELNATVVIAYRN